MQPIFITGIGTGVGKTIVSAIVTEALQADYWKPVQAGFEEGTDALLVQNLITNPVTRIHPEKYKLALPASPHIAAENEGMVITVSDIVAALPTTENLVIEGAGGIMVPLNKEELMIDLVLQLKARVVIVSRNYLGSINHSLLTASLCKQKGVDVAGWVFNDRFMRYEEDIVALSGFKKIASIPYVETLNKEWIEAQANALKYSDGLKLLTGC